MNANAFRSFSYKTKLVESTAAVNGILEGAAIAGQLKYLSNFWRSFEMLLINYKVKLKFKMNKTLFLATNGPDNTNADPNNIVLPSRTQNYLSL